MTPEQENLLFESIGSIKASQEAILNSVAEIKADIHHSIEKSEARQKVVTDALKEDLKASELRQIAAINKHDDRLTKVEEKLTNQRIKVATMGGAAGLTVSLIAYAVKNGIWN
ncbi:hypothetical protein FQP85_03045 [Pseudoalteromonas neustonica]|uniref:DUF1640 domain-containing protein n=1 Tax=Pseudoalteromonas neustonica TaxID=1840331 RepID=A0ABY3FI75_9GAMM|nr:hypothetical protein [Pseudoalteromonas neustonica]TVU86066.1 hypothetical protein FQP85_03045 [Pseudoalteromonas neustonica]